MPRKFEGLIKICPVCKREHSENSSKRERSSITPEQLFGRVLKFDQAWEEHELVLHLIKEWKTGRRFSAEEYRRKSDVISFFSL